MHKHNLVHCNVKPSNVMLFKHLKWKIIDLHSAARVGESSVGGDDVAYVAPEVLKAELAGQKAMAADPAVDMWAFGIIAYEVLTGDPTDPWTGDLIDGDRAEILWR